MKLVGLTGGIASGKTVVSNRFASLGVPVVDADILARQVVEPGSEGLATLVETFGNIILNAAKNLDRAALRKLIFENPSDRRIVEGILHPRIRKLSDEQIQSADDGINLYVVYAVPLLFETSQKDRFDRILVVDVPSEVQIQRLMLRDTLSRERAQAILDAQANREQRLSIADDVILNNGELEKTLGQVDALHDHYRELWA